jgi:hypothetical protein
MVRLQTLDLRIGVRVPASQPNKILVRRVFPLSMRIRFSALAAATLGCWNLSAQQAGSTGQLPPQQTGAPQAQPPPPPNIFSQSGNADIFQQAPPGVEDALRARLALFYQCQVDSTFRKGEQYVAEESKDRYYNGRHQKYFSYRIIKIKFSDDFSSAQVTVLAEVDLHFQGQVVRSPMPFTANWKLENGLWCWYVPVPKPGELQHTPFGDVVTPDPKDAKAEQPGDVTAIGKRFANPEAVLSRFESSPTLSKPIAWLGPDNQFHDEIIFGNVTKAAFKFHIDKDLPPGVTVEPMSGELNPRDGVILKISYKHAGSTAPAKVFQRCNILYGPQDLMMPFYVKMGSQ